MFISRRCAVHPKSLPKCSLPSHDSLLRILHIPRRAMSSEAAVKLEDDRTELNRLSAQLKLQHDSRARLSKLWTPTGGIAEAEGEDAHSKLIRAGYLRQAHSGIFHFLPLGRRVQEKVEALIDKHMSTLGASKLSLSSISSEELWLQSGRLNKASSELFHFSDRKDVGYLLSPTHEEEITSLVANTIKSYKELPIRLYQISRKYRDELRPRHGLLRSREFVMKDLYTFDLNKQLALDTYHQVRAAYKALFDELKLPYLIAEADSGDIGGDLSHEFHFPTPKGEDHIISCGDCHYVANEELAESRLPQQPLPSEKTDGWVLADTALVDSEGTSSIAVGLWRGISKDRLTLINVWFPQVLSSSSVQAEVNPHSINRLVPDLDSGVEDPISLWTRVKRDDTNRRNLINVVDTRLPETFHKALEAGDLCIPQTPSIRTPANFSITTTNITHLSHGQSLDLLRIRPGDSCPRCETGVLDVQKAIELGHTFFLGTRYSDPLKATVAVPQKLLEGNDDLAHQSPKENGQSIQQAIQMGCHGIGVSRMIAAVAETLCDDRGLNWPRVMAPYEIIVVPGRGLDNEAMAVYDVLDTEVATDNVIFDDRASQFSWKMKDADQAGYPIIVVIGRSWSNGGLCEVQCRRLNIRQEVPFTELVSYVRSLLARL